MSKAAFVKKAALPGLLLLGFVVHRLLVALSAGDFLHPIEPSEAKNTQIAWDLLTGRFGTDGFDLAAYVANSGSVHHAAYSTTALVYLVVNKILGFGLLSVRAVPLLFWTAALGIWGVVLHRAAGATASVLGLLATLLVPTVFVAHAVTFQGSHSESVLPLAVAVGAWMWFVSGDRPDPRRGFALGAAFGYAVIFNYLLVPPVGLMVLLLLVPPRPRLDGRTIGAGLAGAALGLWPLWLILALEPTALGNSITEIPETTVAHQALGGGADLALLWRTIWDNLPYGWDDYWMRHDGAGALWGGIGFERASYRVMVFGPLLLLPFALATRRPALRRLALLIGLAPALTYLAVVWSTPFKPYVPSRYLVGTLFLAWSTPALLATIGLEGLRSPRGKVHGALALALAVSWFTWQAPPRLVEAAETVRLERAPDVIAHRYVTYYNLGIGTIWASQVEAVNRLIDVRAAEGDAHAFDGVQAGLWMLGNRRGLGRGEWEPTAIDWPLLRGAMGEWQEHESYATEADRARPQRSAENIGWGVAIRLDGDLDAVITLLEGARTSGEWPTDLPLEAAWRGVGQAFHGDPVINAPTEDGLNAAVPPAWRAAVLDGLRIAAERGPVPPAQLPLKARGVRGTAT